jgi:hypothetical protein
VRSQQPPVDVSSCGINLPGGHGPIRVRGSDCMIVIIRAYPAWGHETPYTQMVADSACPKSRPVCVEFGYCSLETLLTEATCTSGANREFDPVRSPRVPGHRALLASTVRTCGVCLSE